MLSYEAIQAFLYAEARAQAEKRWADWLACYAADVRFFADFNSKAVEYGQQLRFTYVIWNDGPVPDRNVVLPVPIVWTTLPLSEIALFTSPALLLV